MADVQPYAKHKNTFEYGIELTSTYKIFLPNDVEIPKDGFINIGTKQYAIMNPIKVFSKYTAIFAYERKTVTGETFNLLVDENSCLRWC